jgi:hypothetical protein
MGLADEAWECWTGADTTCPSARSASRIWKSAWSARWRKTIGDRDRDVRRALDRPQPGASRRRLCPDTIFEGRIAHGMLTAGLISAVIGEQLPGHGTVYLGQTLKFMAPVRPGDRVEAEVEVTAIDHARGAGSPLIAAAAWAIRSC